MFWVYVLERSDNKYYIGQTNNLKARLSRHNSGYCKSTKPYLPLRLVKAESYHTRSDAVTRERYLKSLKSKSAIEALLKGPIV